jgi:hypothetical protein
VLQRICGCNNEVQNRNASLASGDGIQKRT